MLIHSIDQIPNSRFIVFEGPNGSGKTTVLERLRSKYHSQIKFTREPGGSRIGETIREILLRPDAQIEPFAELFLILADRAEHVQALKTETRPIISDRYYYSTIAFQGSGRGLGEEFTQKLCSMVTQGLVPQLVVLLDVDPQIGLLRKRNEGRLDRFEQEEIEFHSRVRESFLRQAEKLTEPFFVIRTHELDFEEVCKLCETIVERAFFG